MEARSARRLLALQIHHHQIVIQLADLLNQLRMIKLSLILHVVRDLHDADVVALLIVVDVGSHLEQVDDSLELIFLADGELQADGILAKSGADLIYSVVEVRRGCPSY